MSTHLDTCPRERHSYGSQETQLHETKEPLAKQELDPDFRGHIGAETKRHHTKGSQPPASGTRPPSQALSFFRVLQPGFPQILILGVSAGADLRLETRDVEGRALKLGKDGLLVLSVRDLKRPLPSGYSNGRVRQVGLSSHLILARGISWGMKFLGTVMAGQFP